MRCLFGLILIGIAMFVSMSYIKNFHGEHVLPGASVELKTREDATKEEKKAEKIEIKYYVTAHDTLEKISYRMYGTGAYAEKIAQYNEISDVNRINSGDVLLIPVEE